MSAEQVLSHDQRETLGDRLVRGLDEVLRRSPRRRDRGTSEERAAADLSAEALPRKQAGGIRAEQDLAGRRQRFHLGDSARSGTADEQLTVRRADQEHRVGAAVDANRHPQDDVAGAGADATDLTNRLLHRGRGGTSPLRVPVAFEPQKHCVATELEERPTSRRHVRQQLGEAVVDRIDELLGALLAFPGQPLGEAREPGHVREHRRSFERFHQLGARCCEAPEQHPGDVAPERPCLGFYLQAEPRSAVTEPGRTPEASVTTRDPEP